MQTLVDLINLMAGLCNLVIVIRLLTYRRGHRRHSYAISVLAWVLINLNLAWCLFLILHGISHPLLALLNLLFALGFAFKLLKTKGNIAPFFQLNTTMRQS